ncbi:MAG: ATP-grasp domain-containing protein [Novosphingobium sp.]
MKVLLIGSSFSAMPFLYELKRLGADVSVIGKYEADPCHSFVEHSIHEDYSDSENLLRICKEHGFDHIVPSCNDYSYVAGAAVANVLGLPGFDSPEVTEILHTKDRFRRFCQEIGVPAPRIYGEVTPDSGTQEVSAQLDGPALVKPVDSFSGRGVELIHSAAELDEAIARAMDMSRGKRAVVEQFVEGALHSHTAFIADGRIIWHQFVDEFCEVYRYQVDRSQFPTRLTAEIRDAVQRAMERVVEALGLCDGLLHTQFIASEHAFWIIECMRRCPGDLYGHHFKFSFGYNYEAQYVAGFLGCKPQPPAADGPSPMRIERRVLSVADPQAFFAVHLGAGGGDGGPEKIYVPLKDSGQKLEAAPFDKAGILFLRGDPETTPEQISATKAHMLFHN